MAATRPSSATGAGSSLSNRWWESKDFAQIHSDAAHYWASGDFAGFEATCQEGLRIARRANNRTAEIAYLNAIGNVRLSQFHYASALEVYLEASRLGRPPAIFSTSEQSRKTWLLLTSKSATVIPLSRQ